MHLRCGTHTLAPVGALSAQTPTTAAVSEQELESGAVHPARCLQGYLAHKKTPPPPRGTIGAWA